MWCFLDALDELIHLNKKDREFVKNLIERNGKDGLRREDFPKIEKRFNLIHINDGEFEVVDGAVRFFNNSKREEIIVGRGKHFIALHHAGWFSSRDHAICVTADKLRKRKQWSAFFVRR
jgi:hypothetical protein